jgi:glycosyltransferase involved in cell wall biosynthesis
LYCAAIVRVLLMSPVSGHDIPGGDVAYTEALVARPPEGVTYTTYVDALADGTLVERGRRPKHSAMQGTDALVFGARAIELGLRRSGIMFREPFRYVTVEPGAFDLMHTHVFPVRLVDTDLPLVTSSGFPLPVLYEDRFGWSHRRVVAATAAERILSRAVGAEVFWLPPRRVARTMVQSAHYRNALIDAGAEPDEVAVRTLGIEGGAFPSRTGTPTTVGFVSTMFEQKGGTVVLAAFQKVLAERPDARLVIVGSERRPHDVPLPEESVDWVGPVSRRRVLDELLATIDVLAHPTRCDSGPPYVILEALQRGIPVVTSDLVWIDEGLTGPAVRRVQADPWQVSEALIDLLDADTYGEASSAAVDLWRTRYSMDVLAVLVGGTYREALAARP